MIAEDRESESVLALRLAAVGWRLLRNRDQVRAAGRELGVPQSTVSRTIPTMEREIGAFAPHPQHTGCLLDRRRRRLPGADRADPGRPGRALKAG
jgi:hypothetical protein